MKVLIADDHTIVREGLKQILKNMDGISIIDEATNGTNALLKIENNRYDLIIMDISMPGKNGIDILKILKTKKISANILILSVHPQEQYAIRAMRLGASGYLNKNTLYEELEIAINTILTGKKYISKQLAESLIFEKYDTQNKLPHEKLSEREFQVMLMLAKGKTVLEIAAELFISDKTVSTHRMRLLQKMRMKKNAELTLYAIRNELIE